MMSCCRQQLFPSESYANSVIERMEIVLSTLKTVLELLNVYDPDSPVERTCVEEYKSAVGNLISACQSIAYWWQEYVDSEQASDRSYAYGTPVVHIRGERGGRPRFDITKDQLEYLSSLSFSWSEIASILGVSRNDRL